MTHASVFSGIGGPEVAATMLGWENLFHCEINPFGRAVLDYWYPNAKSYEDITKTDFTEWRGRVDVLTGGFPCQPFSYAGQRRGADDDRYLWPYMFKCIDAIRPTWVVAENVGGILTMVEQGEVSEVGVQGLFSVRRTLFEDTNCERPLPLNASATTLRRTDTPSSRCLFRLVPLERRTDGTVCSSSEEEETILLQTPTTVQTDEPPERMRERAERNGYKNGTKFGSLTSQIKYDERLKDLLPTPVVMEDRRKIYGEKANDEKRTAKIKTNLNPYSVAMLLPTPLVVEREHPERVEALRATGATKINSRANGEQRPNGIVDFMNFYGMLPTPTVSFGGNYLENPDFANRNKGNLEEEVAKMVVNKMLPTPVARDYKGAEGRDYTRAKSGETERHTLPGIVEIPDQKSAENDGLNFRLSPLFTEEMMGFPFLWTTLPFLRQSGAQKPSKPTATP